MGSSAIRRTVATARCWVQQTFWCVFCGVFCQMSSIARSLPAGSPRNADLAKRSAEASQQVSNGIAKPAPGQQTLTNAQEPAVSVELGAFRPPQSTAGSSIDDATRAAITPPIAVRVVSSLSATGARKRRVSSWPTGAACGPGRSSRRSRCRSTAWRDGAASNRSGAHPPDALCRRRGRTIHGPTGLPLPLVTNVGPGNCCTDADSISVNSRGTGTGALLPFVFSGANQP